MGYNPESVRAAAIKGIERVTGTKLAKVDRGTEILDELEALQLVPATQEVVDRMQQLSVELANLGAGEHVESGDRWWKPAEGEVGVVIVEGLELREDNLNKGRTQRVYRVRKGADSLLLGETFALQKLSHYPAGTKVVIRSLGKESIGGGKSVHRFALTPAPGPSAVLPVVFDWKAPNVEVTFP